MLSVKNCELISYLHRCVFKRNYICKAQDSSLNMGVGVELPSTYTFPEDKEPLE